MAATEQVSGSFSEETRSLKRGIMPEKFPEVVELADDFAKSAYD